MEHPLRLVVNAKWEEKVNGAPGGPTAPLPCARGRPVLLWRAAAAAGLAAAPRGRARSWATAGPPFASTTSPPFAPRLQLPRPPSPTAARQAAGTRRARR
jgi:hypothetical protein